MNTADNTMRLIKFNTSDIVVRLARLEKLVWTSLGTHDGWPAVAWQFRCGSRPGVNSGFEGTPSASRRPEAEHAVGFLSGQTPLDQHVIDMGDQFAGGESRLVHVECVLVEHHRHQFLG